MAGTIKGRIALTLEYDGSNYAGWQYQDNADTVQNQVQRALTKLFGHPIQVDGASRTDSGVHARGQVAAFDLPRPFQQRKLVSALNWHLPRDIRGVKAVAVPSDFDPQRQARGKLYRYFIFNRPQQSAIARKYHWHVPASLDVAKMNAACLHCRGKHDFSSFQASGNPVANTVRTLQHLVVTRRGETVVINCVGDGFLYNMVRIIAGTLVQMGLAKMPPQQMKSIICAKNRRQAGPTAPPQGLFLERVQYSPPLDSYTRLY